MDCSKAFDLAKFSLIFSRALDSGLPTVVARVLLFTYKEQAGWRRWGRNCNSETFNFRNCPSPEVAVLARISARDIRSSLGKNLQRIRELTQLDPWSATKTELHAALERGLHIETPKADTWRPRCLANLLAERSQAFFRADDDEVVRLTSLIKSLMTN